MTLKRAKSLLFVTRTPSGSSRIRVVQTFPKLIPAITMSGSWTLRAAPKSVILLPGEGATMNRPTCPDHRGRTEVDVEIGPSTGGAGKYEWAIGGTVAVRNGAARLICSAHAAALFLPRPTILERYLGTRWTIPINVYEVAIAGYYLDFSAELEITQLALNPARPSMDVSAKLAGGGRARVVLDVPCVGEQEIASADIRLGQSNLDVTLQPSGDFGPRVKIIATDIAFTPGPIQADFRITNPALIAAAGGTTFVTDRLMNGLIEKEIRQQLPARIREGVQDLVASIQQELLDFRTVPNASQFHFATMRADADAVLFGIAGG